jgi:hypothetical protein
MIKKILLAAVAIGCVALFKRIDRSRREGHGQEGQVGIEFSLIGVDRIAEEDDKLQTSR